jgi:hypothetical protein
VVTYARYPLRDPHARRPGGLTGVPPLALANGGTLTRARILLKAGEGWSDAELMRAFDACQKTIRRIRLRFAQGGVEAVLAERHQTRRRQGLTGEQAAHLIAIACTPAPAGHEHWTVRLLAAKAVELGLMQSIAKDTMDLCGRDGGCPGPLCSALRRRAVSWLFR